MIFSTALTSQFNILTIFCMWQFFLCFVLTSFCTVRVFELKDYFACDFFL